jgi:hypothetical protein
LRAADVVLAEQQHLDREVRVCQQRRKGHELAEHRDRRRALRRPAAGEHLAVLVDPDDPSLGGDGVHDSDAVLVEQRVELLAERAEPARLDLDQLAVGADEVHHESTDGHLEAVTRLREQGLHGGVQRTFAHDADARHGSGAGGFQVSRRGAGGRPATARARRKPRAPWQSDPQDQPQPVLLPQLEHV